MRDCDYNPYNAPGGAIVVVAAGAPGTSNPTAGDISVRSNDSADDTSPFYNGGEMNYVPYPSSFPTEYTLGIYVPTACSADLQHSFYHLL